MNALLADEEAGLPQEWQPESSHGGFVLVWHHSRVRWNRLTWKLRPCTVFHPAGIRRYPNLFIQPLNQYDASPRLHP